jgi:hypothetical protein
MSDYSIMRAKKNAELQNAMSNVRKDLYEWKPSSPNLFKHQIKTNPIVYQTPPSSVRLKSIESNKSSNTIKRSDSMKDLKQQKKFLDLNIEDLNNIDDTTSNNEEKLYLNSARNLSLLAVRKDQNEIDKYLELKLNSKQQDANNILELDLSQCNLKSTKNLQKVKNYFNYIKSNLS